METKKLRGGTPEFSGLEMSKGEASTAVKESRVEGKKVLGVEEMKDSGKLSVEGRGLSVWGRGMAVISITGWQRGTHSDSCTAVAKQRQLGRKGHGF